MLPPCTCAHLTLCLLPVFQHPGGQPFLDQPHDAPVRHTVLDELHQPFVPQRIEEAANVGIEHPVHLLRHDAHRERIQRLMWIATRPESVGETEEVLLVDCVEHLDDGALDDFILQRGNTERPLPPVRLADVRSANRLCPVRPPLKPLREPLEVLFQSFAVVAPGLAINARSGVSLDAEIGRTQPFDVVDVMQERGEPLLPVPSCCLTYPLQRAGRAHPALCPARVALKRVPLGHAPSLHRLRNRSRGLVRRLRRYYGPVRLPATVHHRRTSCDFPIRSAPSSATDGRGISRFPHKVFPYMLRAFDRAGSCSALPWRRLRCGLPLFSSTSAPRSNPPRGGASISRLNTGPVPYPGQRFTPALTDGSA